MEKKEVGNLPVLSIKDIGIPTKKLNTIEQKNYRNYADTVCDSIKDMLRAIREVVLKKYEDENEKKIEQELLKAFKLEAITEETIKLRDEAEAINNESKKIAISFEQKMDKLRAEKELALAKIKDEKMHTLIEKYNKLRDKITGKKEIQLPFRGSITIKNVNDYTYDFDDEDENILGRPKRNLNYTYPMLTITEIIGRGFSGTEFIYPYDVNSKLEEIMAPAKHEFDVAELKLAKMEQSVKEVMLFDEMQMNQAFRSLLEFRDSIQQKHIEVVKGINIKELE